MTTFPVHSSETAPGHCQTNLSRPAKGAGPRRSGRLSLVKTSSINQHPILRVRVREHHSTEDPTVRAADEVLTRDR